MTVDSTIGLEWAAAGNGTGTGQSWGCATGDAIAVAEGTWDGATVTFKVSSKSGVTTQTASGISLTSSAPHAGIQLFDGEFIEPVIAGGGGSTSLTVSIRKKS